MSALRLLRTTSEVRDHQGVPQDTLTKYKILYLYQNADRDLDDPPEKYRQRLNTLVKTI